VELHFAIYPEQADATALWQETQTLQLDEQGRYSVLLGAMQAEGLPVELFTSGEARWLGVAAGKLPEQPRVLMVSVPYALKAADAETLGGKPASAYALTSSSGTAPLVVALPASGTTAASLTNLTGTQPKAAVSAGATEFTDTTTDQVVKVFQNGSGYGLYAVARNNSAVFGRVLGTSAMTFGVRGMTLSTSGAGVFGESTSTTGAGYGVRGQSVSGAGGGVLGMNTSPTGPTYGVMGITDSADGVALAARARATTGAALGVQAITSSPNSTAVFAQAAAGSGPTTGVLARVGSPAGTALVADNLRGGKILSARVGDVEKLSVSGNGNVLTSGSVTAASFSGSGAGLTGVAALTAVTTATAATAATATNAENLGGVPAASFARRYGDNTFNGDQTVNGTLTVNGNLTATQFYGNGSALTISHSTLASVLARLQAVEHVVLPPSPGGSHIWSKVVPGGGEYSYDNGAGVAVDASGNVLVTGGYDVVAKYSGADGSTLWLRHLAINGSAYIAGVAVDAGGNVILVGGCTPTVDFGGGPLTSPAMQDFFVVKLSGIDGSHLWSKRYGLPHDGSDGLVRGHAVAVDASGNVLVTGYYYGRMDFGGEPFGIAAQIQDVFVAKYSGVDGSHLWSKAFGGVDEFMSEQGTGVAVDASGNVLVTGYSGGSFVARCSGVDGSQLWRRALDFGPQGLAVDATGHILLAGSGPLLTKLDSWSKHFTPYGDVTCLGLAVDTAGNVVLTGWFSGILDLGGDEPLAGYGVFVAKFSGVDGSHVWSKSLGTPPNDSRARAPVALDANGNVLVTGWFEGTVDFGGGPLTGGVFLLKLHP
jgi:hypothetical protein